MSKTIAHSAAVLLLLAASFAASAADAAPPVSRSEIDGASNGAAVDVDAPAAITVKPYDVFVDLPSGFAFVRLPAGWKFVGALHAAELRSLPPTVLTTLLPPESEPERQALR